LSITANPSLVTPDLSAIIFQSASTSVPVYTAGRAASGPGRMIRLHIGDDDAGKLDLVLGQVHRLLGENGDVLAQGLIVGATLILRRDGGIYYPTPGDNWNADTYEAVLTVDAPLVPEFTGEVTDRIWVALGTVLNYHGREDVQALMIEPAALPLPPISADWRAQAARRDRQPPNNQARRERAEGGYPSEDGPVFGSRAEFAVYQVLAEFSGSVLPIEGSRGAAPARGKAP
jgi:hypothetical protein